MSLFQESSLSNAFEYLENFVCAVEVTIGGLIAWVHNFITVNITESRQHDRRFVHFRSRNRQQNLISKETERTESKSRNDVVSQDYGSHVLSNLFSESGTVTMTTRYSLYIKTNLNKFLGLELNQE